MPYFLAAGVCGFLLYFFAPVARKIGLVDRPNDRKLQQFAVPVIGGLAMGISVPLSMLLFPIALEPYRTLFFCVGILLIAGVLDDHQDIPAGAKFAVQLIAAALLVFIDDQAILFIGDIFATGISQGLSTFAPIFTIIAIVTIINAFNMIDGHDGLAASVALISLGSLIVLSITTGVGNEHFFLLTLLMTVIATFLLFNLPWLVGTHRQIYMGDAGSMLLGLMIAYFLVDLSQRGTPITEHGIPAIKPTAIPWVIGLPLLDEVSVIIKRILKGRRPWRADRGHFHHFLLDLGLERATVLWILVALQLVFTTGGVLGTLHDWPDWILFWGTFAVLAVYMVTTHFTPRRKPS